MMEANLQDAGAAARQDRRAAHQLVTLALTPVRNPTLPPSRPLLRYWLVAPVEDPDTSFQAVVDWVSPSELPQMTVLPLS